MTTYAAWDLIGFDGTLASFDPQHPVVRAAYEAGSTITDSPYLVRVKGGRTLYESVDNNGGEKVRLSRLDTTDGLRAIVRYVDPDTEMEVVRN
jgi:hypothetical protein